MIDLYPQQPSAISTKNLFRGLSMNIQLNIGSEKFHKMSRVMDVFLQMTTTEEVTKLNVNNSTVV